MAVRAYIPEMTVNSAFQRCVLLACTRRVGRGVEQCIQVAGIRWFQLEQPGGIGILVNRFRGIDYRLIYVGDGAGDWRINIRRRFH